MTDNLALYRKYRPKSFKEVLGQDHIIEVLESSIKNDKVAHAYLFVGTRGTGKTTVARIMAQELKVSQSDLYEIDAASNRGIDDIRELRDGVRVLPFDSKYKVYIIDEVHMLSKDAWGALLKTLEEPPKHVIFILATTELHKVPDTIISRCQVFTFKKASDIALKKNIENVAKEEGFELGGGVAEFMSILADGSFRDGLGVLQKILNHSIDKKSSTKTKQVTLENVEEITGAPKTKLVNDFITALSEEDIENAITTIEKAGEMNLDMKLLLKLIILKFRMAIILRYAPKLEQEMLGDLSEKDLSFLKDLVKKEITKKGKVITSKSLAVLLEAYTKIDSSFIQGLPIELAVMDITSIE